MKKYIKFLFGFIVYIEKNNKWDFIALILFVIGVAAMVPTYNYNFFAFIGAWAILLTGLVIFMWQDNLQDYFSEYQDYLLMKKIRSQNFKTSSSL